MNIHIHGLKFSHTKIKFINKHKVIPAAGLSPWWWSAVGVEALAAAGREEAGHQQMVHWQQVDSQDQLQEGSQQLQEGGSQDRQEEGSQDWQEGGRFQSAT